MESFKLNRSAKPACVNVDLVAVGTSRDAYELWVRPVAVRPEPVAVQPEPMAVDPEPVAVKPKSMAIDPEPVAVDLEPVAVKPKPKTVKCAMCPSRCAGKADLWRHVRATHDAEEHRLACRVPGCGRRFITVLAAFEHWQHHTRDAATYRCGYLRRADTCELCGRPFGGRSALRNHMSAQHPESRVGACSVCGRFLGDRYAAMEHACRDHCGSGLRPAQEPAGPYRSRRRRRDHRLSDHLPYPRSR